MKYGGPFVEYTVLIAVAVQVPRPSDNLRRFRLNRLMSRDVFSTRG